MSDWEKIKQDFYDTNTSVQLDGRYGSGIVFFGRDCFEGLVGKGHLTYDEYLDLQYESCGSCI